MNREIKFRGYHTEMKKMFSAEEMGEDQLTITTDGRGFINVSGTNTRLSQFIKEMIPMQYTGLKDKNGKEIYEGDILKRGKDSKPTFVAVIEFSNGQFGGATYPNRNHWIEMPRLNRCDYDGNGYDEVIGNIYENPELLNSEQTAQASVATEVK